MTRDIGDYHAQLGAFVNRHCHRYYRRSQPEDRLDMRNEVALIAHRRLDEVADRSESEFQAWLSQTSKNVVRNWSRRERTASKHLVTRSATDDHEPLVEMLPGGQPGADAEMISQERVDAVRQAISELSDMHRQVVWLFYIDQMAEKDIATRLGIRRGTVKSRLHTARRLLTDTLRHLVADEHVTPREAVR